MKIIITKLAIPSLIGVYEWEKQQLTELLLDAEITLAHERSGKSDMLDDTVDYDMLRSEYLKVAKKKHYQLIEALAHDLAKVTLHYELVSNVTIRLSKPKALIGAQNVAIEITASQQNN